MCTSIVVCVAGGVNLAWPLTACVDDTWSEACDSAPALGTSRLGALVLYHVWRLW